VYIACYVIWELPLLYLVTAFVFPMTSSGQGSKVIKERSKPQVPVTNYLYSPIPLYIGYYIIVKVYNTLSVPLSDNARTNNKNASISTTTIFKFVHKTLFHKLKPFIGSCYNLHMRYGNSK